LPFGCHLVAIWLSFGCHLVATWLPSNFFGFVLPFWGFFEIFFAFLTLFAFLIFYIYTNFAHFSPMVIMNISFRCFLCILHTFIKKYLFYLSKVLEITKVWCYNYLTNVFYLQKSIA
jgi:hypothetical protein